MPTVLIAEDEPRIVAFLEKGLRRSGLATEVAADGSTVLEKIAQDAFDLLILDLGLPQVDGMDILKMLGQSNAALPVLVVTARSLDRQDLNALHQSNVEVIHKPFLMKELLRKVQALLTPSAED
ncbi:MAG: response regulator [Cyanobacteria bacterium P01_C01_bin.70]